MLLLTFMSAGLIGCGGGSNQDSSSQTSSQESQQTSEQSSEASSASSKEQSSEQSSEQTSSKEEQSSSAESSEDLSSSEELPSSEEESSEEPSSSEDSSTVMEDKDISIIYTTDVHCGIDNYLGYAAVSHYKNSLEATNYVALVDSGDYLQGEFIGAISEGEYVMEIMNEMNYDVITLGNHEFDYGIDVLKERLNEFNGDVTSCNFSYIGTKENKLDMVKPYVIKQYGNRKVGFIGITTPKTLTTSDPKTFIEDDQVAYDFGASTTEGFYELIQNNIDRCKSEGADYVIALSHLGSPTSFAPFSSIDVIKNTTGLDAFLDGHSHTDLPWTKEKNKEDKDTLLVDTGYKLNEFASLTISVEGEISYDFISEYADKDEHINEVISSIKARAKEEGSKVVANIDIDLDAEKNYIRTREAPIGDLIADAYRYYGEADIGVINGGGIRDGLAKGDVTYEQILNVHPFGNNLMKKKTTGSKIRDYLEFACKNVTAIPKENQFGGFAQVSGLQYVIDTTIASSVVTTASGDFVSIDGERRVKDIKVLENDTYVDLVDEKEYTIASIDFLLEDGGDGANLFMDDETLGVSALLDYQVLVHYIADVLDGKLSDTYSKVDNRIIIAPKGGDDGRIITINKDMLFNTKLEDYRHPDKTYNKNEADKKFTIDVGNGKTIEGAIIFRDCGYQYVGETLLDAFGAKNTSNEKLPYNFNILFSMDNLMRLDFSYTAYSSEYNWIEQEIKFGNLDNDPDFYTSLGNVPYDWITERAGGGYGRRLFPGGNKAASNYYTINSSSNPDTMDRHFGWALVDEPCNLVAFNISYAENTLLYPQDVLNFHINQIQLTYQSE